MQNSRNYCRISSLVLTQTLLILIACKQYVKITKSYTGKKMYGKARRNDFRSGFQSNGSKVYKLLFCSVAAVETDGTFNFAMYFCVV